MIEYPFSLKDKTVIITGASSGIGRQCAITCSQMGASIVLVALEEQKLLETLSLLSPGQHTYFAMDITKYDDLDHLISSAVDKCGKIYGFIHSAGIELTLPLKVLKPEFIERAFAVNTISAFEIAKRISNKKYLSDRGGSFVFISSIVSDYGQSGKIGYSSSKGALVSGARSMALELASRKIRVNCVSPGVVETEMSKQLFESISEEARNDIIKMHPMGIGKPIDIANCCLFLLSEESNWITGINLHIDGGYGAQ